MQPDISEFLVKIPITRPFVPFRYNGRINILQIDSPGTPGTGMYFRGIFHLISREGFVAGLTVPSNRSDRRPL